MRLKRASCGYPNGANRGTIFTWRRQLGCDIHVIPQKRVCGAWVNVNTNAFSYRHYGIFGFLAGVRNYSGVVTPISEPRGLPEDFEYDEVRDGWLGDHSFSWLLVKELTEFDYDALMEDRRYEGIAPGGYISGALACDPGKGKLMTYREFLGERFFKDLDSLVSAGIERIVFWFDS